MTRLALWDIDGTLADDSHRVDHALNKRWGEYFDVQAMSMDVVLEEGARLLNKLHTSGDFEIRYLTGRRIDRYDVTKEWLTTHGFPNPEKITMKSHTDKMILAEFKVRKIFEMVASEPFETVVLFDDDPEVVRLVKEHFGNSSAVHCTWYIKPAAMVKAAKA